MLGAIDEAEVDSCRGAPICLCSTPLRRSWLGAMPRICSTAFFSGNRNLVRDVMVAGAWVVRDGRHRDAERIAARYRATVGRWRAVSMAATAPGDAVFRARGVTKVYHMGEVEVAALRGVDRICCAASSSCCWGLPAAASPPC